MICPYCDTDLVKYDAAAPWNKAKMASDLAWYKNRAKELELANLDARDLLREAVDRLDT